MRIAIGSDHHGFARKGELGAALEAEGHVVLDLGAFSAEPVDYPDYARVVGQAVLREFVEVGVLVCGNAIGAAIAANKLRGVRAAVCMDNDAARASREQIDANVLCVPAAAPDDRAVVGVALAWLGAKFSGDPTHVRELTKLIQMEAAPATAERAAAPAKPEPAPRAVEPVAPIAEPARPVAASVPSPAPSPAAPSTRDALALPIVEETLAFLESREFLDRLWVKDTSLWRGDADAIRNRLGWLTSPAVMRSHVDELKAFADEIRRLQFSQIVVLGAGGASLAAQVMKGTFRSRMGFPDLFVLDTSDPAAIKQTLDSITPARTLFVVASKSGTTAETLALYAHFRGRAELTAPKPGLQFIAITDPDTPLQALATEHGFRRTFLNAASIGGRYSALSFFGLLPAALIGVDVKTVLERTQAMVEQCGDGSTVRDSPAVRLGAAIAGLARAGRDKVTLVLSDPIRTLGPWIEHLLAESLGKNGLGVVPVVDEALGNPAAYGADRVFVALVLRGDTSFDAALAALDQAGHPVIRIALADPLDIGAEFFRWEMATATAAAVLGVNPYDEPDAGAAAEQALALLSGWRTSRRMPEWPVAAEEEGIALQTRTSAPAATVAEGLAAHLAQAGAEDYVALLAYLPPAEETWSRLQALRVLIRDRMRIATTLGVGPRYLHTTGQLHKGGRPGGVFIQIVGEDKDDLTIPGAAYGFAALKAAQAQGDLEALHEAGRPVIRLRLAGKPGQGLQQLLQIARTATRRL